MRPLKLLGRRVLVRRIPDAEVTQSGLILPSAAREKPNMGEVVAVGTQVQDLWPGEHVLFNRFHDRYLELDGERLLHFYDTELHAAISR